jgi:serine/threonine-protein kinase
MAVARLNHPNIVAVYELSGTEGQMYFSMELCEGPSLSRKLREEGAMPPRDAAALVLELALGVQHAHEQGILHRDLKPSNILTTASGQPKIADFGLARVQQPHLTADLTVTGMVMGTPLYMAPEQARGNLQAIGPATDVYGLGAILYQTLTGRAPAQGRTMHEILSKVLFEPPEPPRQLRPDLDEQLETICVRCLRKNAEDRYPSAKARAEDLLRYLNREPILSQQPSLPGAVYSIPPQEDAWDSPFRSPTTWRAQQSRTPGGTPTPEIYEVPPPARGWKSVPGSVLGPPLGSARGDSRAVWAAGCLLLLLTSLALFLVMLFW